MWRYRFCSQCNEPIASPVAAFHLDDFVEVGRESMQPWEMREYCVMCRHRDGDVRLYFFFAVTADSDPDGHRAFDGVSFESQIKRLFPEIAANALALMNL